MRHVPGQAAEVVHYPRGTDARLYSCSELTCLGTWARTQPQHRAVPLPTGADSSSLKGLSAVVKSPPDFSSDKLNELNFLRLIDQLTSEKHSADTWILFHAVCLMSTVKYTD